MNVRRRRYEEPTEHTVASDAENVALFESALRQIHSRYEGEHVQQSVKDDWRDACDEARAKRRLMVEGDPKRTSGTGTSVLPKTAKAPTLPPG